MSLQDTIVAISTPPGAGGIGVVRLSGSSARQIAGSMLRFESGSDWEPRYARVAELLDEGGAPVDQILVTWFAAPRSYTGEDLIEFSCHGSPVVLRHCVERALRVGARHANPGEFTLRAFVNGRIDLPQAEAVRDLIHATTLHQARVAAQQLEGSVSRVIAPLKAQLIDLIALLEAGIDFAEDDISVATNEAIVDRIRPVLSGVARLLDSFQFGKLVHQGLTIAIVGRPNVGKSSLFNALLQQDRAIVSDIPGTTRDTVSETFSLEGIPTRLVDTAGIRTSDDVIERIGIERSRQAMSDADITLVVIDLSQPLMEEDEALLERADSLGHHLVVGCKCDLPRVVSIGRVELATSSTTYEGLSELKRRLVALIAPDGFASPQSGLITDVRHELLLKESREALERTLEAAGFGLPHEMLLLDCYASLRPLDVLTGATSADDILNRIFSTFCIGK